MVTIDQVASGTREAPGAEAGSPALDPMLTPVMRPCAAGSARSRARPLTCRQPTLTDEKVRATGSISNERRGGPEVEPAHRIGQWSR